MRRLSEITAHLDRYLRVREVADWPNALNGLQAGNSGGVKKIGAAVDACEFSINRAVERSISLLIVHHGLFWNGVQPLTGATRRKMNALLNGDLAVYSAHLPLDTHPIVGNNVLLCNALGLTKKKPFLFEKHQFIGLKARSSMTRDSLVAKFKKAVGGPVTVCPGGPERVKSVGVITGAAGGEIYNAAAEGIDTLITGEGPHWSFTAAEELGINVLYGGHYATETFGVKALAARLSRRFRLPWEFIDHPTGL
jgi:dinuclear metal center YbgI/SA1388 family protein